MCQTHANAASLIVVVVVVVVVVIMPEAAQIDCPQIEGEDSELHPVLTNMRFEIQTCPINRLTCGPCKAQQPREIMTKCNSAVVRQAQ